MPGDTCLYLQESVERYGLAKENGPAGTESQASEAYCQIKSWSGQVMLGLAPLQCSVVSRRYCTFTVLSIRRNGPLLASILIVI